LGDLGLPAQWEEAASNNYLVLLRSIERTLEGLFKLYGIGIYRLKSVEAVPLPGEPRRSETVLKHDRRVARELEETAGSANEGRLLCSQDRWLVRVLTDKHLLALHPAVLHDVLQIVRPRGHAPRLAAVRELAATFSERAIADQRATHQERPRDIDWQRFKASHSFGT
jgi:hypothetical protein